MRERRDGEHVRCGPRDKTPLPADLVGKWIADNTTYSFMADGSYFMVGILYSKGSCVAYEKIQITDNGNAAVSGNQLTLSAVTTKQDTFYCNNFGATPDTSKTSPGDTTQFTWSVNGTTLTMIGATGQIDFTKQ